MTNQQHLISAAINTSIAIANNSTLKKYRDSLIFLMVCDGTTVGSTVMAGEKKHFERHLFNVMCADPALAVSIKNAYDRAMGEPEIAEKIESLQRCSSADEIINRVINPDE